MKISMIDSEPRFTVSEPLFESGVDNMGALKLHVLSELTLEQIQRLLVSAGIDCVVLKGPHLAYTVWPVPTLRIWNDIDILVRPAHYHQALEILVRNGFYKPTVDKRHRSSAPRYHNTGLYSQYGIHIELHRDLTPHDRYPVPIEGLFERAETFRFLETEAQGLSTPDLLLHLCLHMTKSYFWTVEKKHFQDIAYLLAKKSINWTSFLNSVNFAKAKVGTWMALRASICQAGAEVPAWVMQNLMPSLIRRFWLERWLNPNAFPVYTGPHQCRWNYQWRVGLALMDRPLDWLPLLMKYGRLRIMDLMGWIGSSRS